MITIKRITMEDPLYAQECALREDVLLRHVGMTMADFRAKFAEDEASFEHFVAVFDHPNGAMVIGCAALRPGGDGVGKLMQMAVHPQRQGEGIGRKLVAAVERRAFGELGLQSLYCHAQEGAFGFYSRLGWEFDSETFEEVGVPHRRMVISQPPERDEYGFC